MDEAIIRLKEITADELQRIADKGISAGNIDHAYKLMDIYKDIATVEGMDHYDNDYSGRTYKDDPYTRYSRAKMDYRRDHSGASHRKIMNSLDECMENYTEKLNEMLMDADTQEEKDMIKRYMNKIRM